MSIFYMKKFLIILFALLKLTMFLMAQGPSDVCVKSTEGKDFWFGFMENRPGFSCGLPLPENYLEVTVTSRYNCQFTITVGKAATILVTDVLQPNVPKKFRIDRSKAEPLGSETIEDKALHLLSDQPLNLYAMNYGYNSADAAVIFPVEALGNEYYAICYEPHVEVRFSSCGFFYNGKNSEFVVVASEDQTQVTIFPSKVTDLFKPANTPFTITLNKGELYQVQSMNYEAPGQGDLTGSLIRSNKPVALYSGSWATTIPKSSVSAWDHLYEQIPPIRSWGRKFVTVPLKTRGMDTYRILASVDNTTVRIGGKTVVVIDQGKFYEMMLNADEPSLVESDHPVLLAQYSNSNDVDRPPSIPQGAGWDGDPSMLIISPVDQTRENVTFVAYDTPEITTKLFVNVVTRDEAVHQIQLDDQPISFTSLPNSGYAYAQIQIALGNHQLNSLEAGKGFIAYVYGLGGVESYGYGVGFNLSTRLDLGGDIHFVRDTILLCNGEAKILDAGSQFTTFLWKPGGETSQKISVNKKGYYEVTASNQEGCTLTKGIYAFESRPSVNLGKDTIFCQPQSVLDAGSGFSSYLWSNNESIRKITVKDPGIYSVTVRDKYGCPAQDAIQIGFGHIPVLNLSQLDTLICGAKSTTVKITADIGNLKLSSSDPSVSIVNMALTVPANGLYPLRLKASDQFNCAIEKNFNIGFYDVPKLNLGNDTTLCQFSSLLLDAGKGMSSYHWNNKDTLQTLSVQNPGNYGVLVKNKYGCVNTDSIRIGYDALPKLDLTKLDTLFCGVKAGILPISTDKGTLSLTSEDATVTVVGLSVNVLKYGSYLFNFKATDPFGCSAEKKFKLGFHDLPQLNLGNDTTICNSKSIILDAGTGMKSYLWSTKDTIRTIKVQNQGIYSVIVKSGYGCLNQDNIQINFVDNPKLDLSKLDTLVCGAKSTILKITADKGNFSLTSSNQSVVVNGLAATASSYGTFPFKFKATDQFACSSETNFTVGFHQTPSAFINLNETDCFNYLQEAKYLGDAQVSQAKFTWIFAGDTLANGLAKDKVQFAIGKEQKNRSFYLKVAEMGCTNSILVKEIKVIPEVSFTASDTLICEQKMVSFTASNSENVVDYHWNWGDGTQESLAKVATHTFAKSGFYDVKLSVKTDKNCSNTLERKSLLEVVPIPSVEFSLADNQCLGSGLQILSYKGNGGDSAIYNWDLSTLSANDVVKNPGLTKGPLQFNFNSSLKIAVGLQVVSKFGCASPKKQLQLLRKPSFSAAASDSSGCAPLTVGLIATAKMPLDQLDYTWNLGNGEFGSGSQLDYSYSIPKSYDVLVTAKSKLTGCQDTLVKSNWINVFPKPKALFSVQNPLRCLVDKFEFQAIDNGVGASYAWNWGDNSTAAGLSASHIYNVDGHYDISLLVTSDHNCTDQTTIKQMVYVAPIPTVGFSMDQGICLNPGVNKLSYLGSATSKDKFYWDLTGLDPSEVIQSPDSTSGPLAFNLTNHPITAISLFVKSQYGCKSEIKSLTVKRKPIFSFSSDAGEGCTPLKISFKAVAADQVDQLDYNWNFGTGGISTGENFSRIFTQPGKSYNLFITAASRLTGCFDTLKAPDFVSTHPNPIAGFSVIPGIAYNDQSLVNFVDKSQDAISYQWNFGDGFLANVKEPEHNYEKVGSYRIVQKVFNQFSCMDSASYVLSVALRRIFTPNAFSPYAENQVDREFKPYSIGVVEKGYHLKILSRWNDVVFQCKNEIVGWNGRLSNGSWAPAGNYVWILDFIDFQGKSHRQMGTVMLLF